MLKPDKHAMKYVVILGDMTTHYMVKVVGPFETFAMAGNYVQNHDPISSPPNLSWQVCPIEPGPDQ